MKIKPFKALRPAPEYAERVASPPYDAIDYDEATAMASGNTFSFLRVTRAEIDLPPGTDPHDDCVYTRASHNFEILRKKQALIEDLDPGLFAYRIAAPNHVQTGVMACCHIDDYINNVIKKHENTRREKEDDRAKLTAILNAHTGPVLLTYADQPEIDSIVSKAESEKPLYEVAGTDKTTHTIWKIGETDNLVKAFSNVEVSYIADGHHRAAAGMRAALERRASATRTEDGEFNWFMAILFPANQLRVLAYNRCVKDLNGMTASAFLDKVRSAFRVSEDAAERPWERGHVNMYLDGKWYNLDCGETPKADPVASLDVSILQTRLLDPILGIHDPRADKRIEYISGARGTNVLKSLVDSDCASVAFSMFPVEIRQLMSIADANGIMPPKSTWFDPKPLSGLLIHTF